MIFLDFETRSAADLKRWGARRYALDTSTQALCLAWSFDQEEKVYLWHRAHPTWATPMPKSKRPDELIERIRSGEPVEAHNAGFEFNIWNECFTVEFPEFNVKLTLDQLYCSAAKASCLSLPRSLDDAVDALGLPDRKIADGRRLINKLSKPMAQRGNVALGKDIWRTRLRKEAFATAVVGETFSYSQLYTLGEEIAASYTPPKDWQVAIRNAVQRDWRDKWKFAADHPNGFIWIARPPGAETILSPREKRTAPTFCEEEHEHRANWEYCKQDVRAERGLSNFCPEMTSREREYWLMDMRMNLRGIALDIPAATAAFDYAAEEAKRLNEELSDLTGGVVQRGSQRARFQKWANERLAEAGGVPLIDTKADTLSFALDGVPTKAGDEAREAAEEPSRKKWDALGPEGENIERSLRICMEVNRSSVAKYKRMKESVCSAANVQRGIDDALHDIMLFNGADRTGRWSGKGVQPHNFVRGYSKDMVEAWDDIMGLDHDLITMIWGEPMVMLAKACRGALIARPGNELYAADFNAIEARKLAWLSGCSRLLDLFNSGGDPYIDMGSAIYKRQITKADKTERALGKKCLGADTLVLTRRGFHPITKITLEDQLWDGIEWVSHQGLLDQGTKPTLDMMGVDMTYDHPISEGCRWHSALDVAQNEKLQCRALGHGSENLPWLDIPTESVEALLACSSNAHAGLRFTPFCQPTSCPESLHDAMHAPKRKPPIGVRSITDTQTSSLMKLIGLGFSIASQVAFNAVTPRHAMCSTTMEEEVSSFMNHGVQIDDSSCSISSRLTVGINPLLSLIGSRMSEAMSRVIYGSVPNKSTYKTDARFLRCRNASTNLKHVYDLANAGPRHRFTILTDRGPLLVHNSILGLGYAMGWEKFQATVLADEGIWLEDEFCQEVVRIYRKDLYPEIPQLWRDTEKAAISAVLDPGGEYYCGGDEFGIGSVSYFMAGRFLHCRLPSGRLLAYLDPQVRQRVTYRFAAINERGKPTTVNFPAKKSVPQHRVRWHAEKLAEKQHKRLLPDPPESFVSPHLSFMGRDTYTKKWKRCGTHGGSLVENYDQASSRDLLAEAMFRVDEMPEFDLLLSIHDEVIAQAAIGSCTVKEFECIMSIVPVWCPGMPIAAEGWAGPRLRK